MWRYHPTFVVIFPCILGGQYSNLQQQAKGVGLGKKWDKVKAVYRQVNDMFGDIVKVTPSSKVVGDMALFMVQNELTPELVLEKGDQLDFPDSVIELFQGYLGQPYKGFSEKLQKVILKGRDVMTTRPGEIMSSIDLEALKVELYHKLGRQVTSHDVLSYALYPQVYLEHEAFIDQFGNVSVLDSTITEPTNKEGKTVAFVFPSF